MIKISPIPAFFDNYIWCMFDQESGKACVVDPGSAKDTTLFLDENKLRLENILITHHHPDHTGGVAQLKKENKVKVWGSEESKLDIFDTRLKHNDTLEVLGQTFTVIHVPGHTLDHIAFFTPKSNKLEKPALFCGDTLFAAGCGRLFEGTPAQMKHSLDILSKLPDDTQIYCAHEYTLANIKFAASLMPQNKKLAQFQEQCVLLRNKQLPTLPTTVANERNVNPFLRSDDPELIVNLKKSNPDLDEDTLSVFTATRLAKDNF